MCKVDVKLRISDFRISYFIICFFFLIKDRSSDGCGWRKKFLLNSDSQSLSCFKKQIFYYIGFSVRGNAGMVWISQVEYLYIIRRSPAMADDEFTLIPQLLLNGSVHVIYSASKSGIINIKRFNVIELNDI